MNVVNSCEGPAEFEAMYPAVVDTLVKESLPAAFRGMVALREAVVAGMWLGLVTRSDKKAAELLSGAIRRGLPTYAAAISVAKGCGWTPGMMIEGWEKTPTGEKLLRKS